MAFYVICDDDCRYEGMTKEEILSVIAQAAEGTLVFDTEAAFITKVKEQNGGYITFWVGTQAEFNALPTIDKTCHYHITDSTKDADIAAAIALKQSKLNWVTEADIDAMFEGTYEGVEDETSGDSPLPIVVLSEAEMTALLEMAPVGSVFKYVGATTDTYVNGGLYIVSEE